MQKQTKSAKSELIQAACRNKVLIDYTIAIHQNKIVEDSDNENKVKLESKQATVVKGH